jgi:hypothetical protein
MPASVRTQPDWLESVTDELENLYREIIREKEAEERDSERDSKSVKTRRAFFRRIVSQI